MKIVEPNVELIAKTTTEVDGVWDLRDVESNWGMRLDEFSTHAENLIEFAGRACYQSFRKPNPATRRNKDYLRRTLFEQGHWSIAEHATATLYFTGVSRAFTHELIRHRHLSYSQLSQRFVDESDANIVLPPALRNSKSTVVYLPGECHDDVEGILAEATEWWGSEAMLNYESLVEALSDEGLPRKQAREAARALLPNMTETRIVVTGNLRAWHEVIQRRTVPDADAEMREVMELVREQLEEVSPVIFGKNAPKEGEEQLNSAA